MDTKTIERIQSRLGSEEEYRKDLVAYNHMIHLEWDAPSTWEMKTWVRKQVSTDAHDAIKSATNIYDTNAPKWEVMPRGGQDKDSAEEMETMLEWWMDRANKMGEGEPFRKSLHNSCLQSRVIYQLDYLPYWLSKDKKKWNKEQKAAMKASSYCILVHDALNVLYETGRYGLKWAAAVTVSPAQEVIDHWSVYENPSTKEGKKVISALAKIKSQLEENEDLKFVHVDYTSHDKREVTVFPTTLDTLDDFANYEVKRGDKHIDIMDCDNKLSFVNWVIVTGESDPMLYSLHKAGIWENQNLYDTIVESTTMRRAVFPILQHTSPTGKPLDVDYNGEQDVIELVNGETVNTVMPPPIDPAMSQISTQNTGKSAQTTGIKGLASIEVAGNVQYSAVQAVIQLHMTTLVPYVRTWEKANAQLGDMAFAWLAQGDGYTEIGYRTKDKGDGKEKGDMLTLSPEDFDPDDLFISCKAVAHTLTDKMQEANYYSSLRNAGAHLSWKEILEKLSEGNGDVLEAEWLEEEAGNAALQMTIEELKAALGQKIKREDAQLQIEMAAKQQELVNSQQPQPAQGAQGQVPPDQSNPMIPGGQGANAAMGGEPTVTSMPGATSPVQGG